MYWRFRRTKTLLPVRLNFSKRGLSLRLGPRGLGYTLGTSGQRVSASVPGTGLGVTHQLRRGPAARGYSALGTIGLVVIVLALFGALFR